MGSERTLNDFMKYPNVAFKLAMLDPFRWSGLPQGEHSLLKNIWFIFGSVNLVYQNFGMIIFLFASNPTNDKKEELYNVSVIAQISETGGVLGLTLVGACKMCMLLYHRHDIIDLLEELQMIFPTYEAFEAKRPRRKLRSKPICSSDLYRVEHYLAKSANLMKLTTIFFIFAYCFYNILPIFEFFYEYYSSNREFAYRYQSNTWYPWQPLTDERSMSSFAAAYICQAQSSLTGVAFIMAGEFMLCFFITQVQLHFDCLANALGALDATDVDANQQLKQLISYHNRLLRISKEINRIFNISFLVNFGTSTIAICLMGFSMVMISLLHAVKYSVGLMSFLVFTLFICYNGSELTTASDKLLPAAFYNNWYEGNFAYRKMILFFMMRSCESSVLNAYKFTTVSMQTYMAILKFSYQLFTFFRAMT